MRPNIARIDSKGRISIPLLLRKRMGLNHGSEFMIKTKGRGEIVVMPIPDTGKKFEVTVSDSNQLKDVMGFLAKNKINIFSSESKNFGGKIKLSAILDFDGDIKTLKKKILDEQSN